MTAKPAPGARRPRLVLLTGLDVRAFRGGEKYAANLARGLLRRGIDVLLYSKVDPNEAHRLAADDLPAEVGVPVRFYRLLWLPLLPPVLRDPRAFVATLRSADTVFTLESTPRFAALVILLARLLGRFSVVGFHHPSQADDLSAELAGRGLRRARARLFRWFLRGAGALHTINEAQAEALRGVGLDNVAMVHSFTTARPVDLPRADDRGFEALFVGPLERDQKGIDLLAAVARSVLAGRPEVRLTVVGSGRDAGLVEPLVEEFPGRVTLRGFVSDEELPKIYAASDALWLTSRAESFSLVALEGFTQGLRVVSFGVPGLKDVTTIYPEGRVPPFDVAAFAARARELAALKARDPAAFRAGRDRLRDDALRAFGAETQVPKLARMLRLEPSTAPPSAP